VPKVDYNQEYNSDYDVSRLTRPQAPGKASIEAFFTTKGNDLYAILPRWSGRTFTLKGEAAKGVKSVRLIGVDAPLRFSATGATVSVELPDLPEPLLGQPAWVLKVSR